MAALLGLAAAAGYGAADFLGGWASRREGVLPVVLFSQLAGLGLLLVVLAPLTGGRPTAAGVGWGGTAGALVAVGLVVYFRGLARGRMGVVATTTSVVTATLPVVVGLLVGERPSGLQVLGIAVAVGAIALVAGGGRAPAVAEPARPPGSLQGTATTDASRPLTPAGPFAPAVPVPPGGRRGGAVPPGVVEALASGVAFGLFFVCMDRTGPGAALWPLLAANLASLGVLAVAAAVTGRRWRPARPSLPAIAAAGVAGTAASLAFLLAVRQGLLSLASVLASLSPAVTVALARVVLRERLAPLQLAGLAAAVAGVALIAAGG